MLVVRVWEEEYREELILNVTVLVVRVWGGQWRGTDTECYCVCCEVVRRGI